MPTDPARVHLGWANRTLPVGTHMCFYYSNDEGLRETLSFVRVGLDEPEEFCVIFADESRIPGLVGWLSEGYAGDIESQVEAGKLALIGGEPTAELLLTSIGNRLDNAMEKGFRLIRFLGFIGWGLPGWPTEDNLLDFERRVNQVVTAYPAVIICTYGVPSLPGASLIYGGLQTHPVTMIGDDIQANPHYRPQPRS